MVRVARFLTPPPLINNLSCPSGYYKKSRAATASSCADAGLSCPIHPVGFPLLPYSSVFCVCKARLEACKKIPYRQQSCGEKHIILGNLAFFPFTVSVHLKVMVTKFTASFFSHPYSPASLFPPPMSTCTSCVCPWAPPPQSLHRAVASSPLHLAPNWLCAPPPPSSRAF